MPLRSQSAHSANPPFSLQDVIPGFLKTANEQKKGEGTSPSATRFIRSHTSIYENLNVTISFGQGRATSIPWIAFTGYDQTVQNGIYPVYLYYKDHNRLILAYGVSETNQAINHWPNNNRLETIFTLFKRQNDPTPKRYGSSFVHSIYDTAKSLDFIEMERNLLALVSEFHAIFSPTNHPHRKAVPAKSQKTDHIEPYNLDIALKELFVGRSRIEFITNTLSYKKNIILQGPPGTGKTFLAKRLAYLKMGKKDNQRIEMVQFHQSYSYEDFVQGYRPNGQGGFELQNGLFYNFCLRAQKDPHGEYFFIIDEINRGNLSKIFGELMMLIETDKRGPEFAISLTYSQDYSQKFYIPDNLYLIGTMNTADRSLAMVDYALRRRFAFVDTKPEFGESFIKYIVEKGASDGLANRISEKFNEINKLIQQDQNLGDGFTIGHSYFCNHAKMLDNDWYNSIIKAEIEHLLKEYWFDARDKAEQHIGNLLS